MARQMMFKISLWFLLILTFLLCIGNLVRIIVESFAFGTAFGLVMLAIILLVGTSLFFVALGLKRWLDKNV